MFFHDQFMRTVCLAALTFAALVGSVLGKDEATADRITVTVSDLAENPAKFQGSLVRVRALYVSGWEGDSFLSDPKPQAGIPQRIWVYWKSYRSQPIFGRPIVKSGVEGWFTGYFHFVPTHKANGMFDPGPFQLDCVEVSNIQKSSSLSGAIRRGDLTEASELVRSGAELNHLDEYDLFPLWHAAESGHLELVNLLLAAGADPNFKSRGGETALLTAAWHCKVAIAKVLIAHGADVTAADGSGETALILSSQTCSDGEMTQLLLDSRADPNAKTTNGVTALMAAERNPLVAQKLLSAGADPAAKDEYGHTVEDESCDRGAEGFYRVCQLVREALAKRKAKN
jgi:hypothetical protein